MAHRPVTHVRRFPDGEIRSLAFPGASWSPRESFDAIRDIESGRHRYFVPGRDRETGIHVVDDPHGKYLRTDWDTTERNNLGDLPDADEFEPGDRASITTWTRVEPRCRTDDLTAGLAAPLYDPLWMLARQWQFGEYQPSDGGSPVMARVRGTFTRLDHYRAGAGAPEWRPYDPAAVPLETLVEREPVTAPRWHLRFAAEAGLHFLRLLRSTGAGHLAVDYLARYRLAAPDHDGEGAEAAGIRHLRVMAGRVPHGSRLYADLDPAVRPPGGAPAGLPELPVVPEADREAVLAAAGAWLSWCDTLAPATGPAPESWVAERVEHAFAVSAPAPHTDGSLVLAASGYPGGHLDWYAFDARVDAAGPDGERAPEPVDVTLLPAPVRFPGMPAPRWWQVEDARVNFAGIETPREDLAQLLLLECALVYGNDWFLFPLELPVGAVCHLDSLEVTDTFGYRAEISSVRGSDPQWRMFSFSGLEPADEVLLVAPTLGPSLSGQPLEEVRLLRDEMANLAWAVERRVQESTGGVVDRAEAYARSRSQEATVDESGSGAAVDLAYRVAAEPPDYWIPLVPVQVDQRQVRLRRGKVLRPDGVSAAEPRGRILQPERPLVLYEEEVPRAGVRVTRSAQYARWIRGSSHLWQARHKQSGRGEAASGLRFDLLLPGAPE